MDFSRKSFGNQYALGKPLMPVREMEPILAKLINKTGSRLRRAGYKAKGIHIALRYKDGSYWHRGKTVERALYDTSDIYKEILNALVELSLVPFL